LALKRRFGTAMIFDLRGLMADEYVDAEHWRKGSLPYRMTKSMERRALSVADGIVTLTERIWPIINQWRSEERRVGKDGRITRSKRDWSSDVCSSDLAGSEATLWNSHDL